MNTRRSVPHTSLFLVCLALAGGALFATAAAAQTVTLTPFKDNTLYEDDTGSLSNGSGIFFFVGRTGINAEEKLRRGILAFDVASAIPAGSQILSATLTLEMSRTVSGPQNLTLHRATNDWGEGASDAGGQEGGGTASAAGDATWIHAFFDTVSWTAPGGDFSATVSATQSVDAEGSYAWGSTAQMVADVQAWLDDAENNFGWILIGNEIDNNSAKRFNSRENVDNETVPQLTITFDDGSIFSDGFESGDLSAWGGPE